ncbi:MAG TPA: hypothetical protein VG052_16030 [Puia sp.]|jgi:hypothetical protein|nr:hypothetical protein [Puia sp.]
MTPSRRTSLLLLTLSLCLLLLAARGMAADIPRSAPGAPASSPQQALDYLLKAKLPDSSAWWPNIKTSLFTANLRANLLAPLAMYQGTNTNFCGYAALSYLPLHDDPLAYVRFMLALYTDGQATWGAVHFNPSPAIHTAAGTLRFKGILDIRPADQLWFLCLADHFRGYLNFFFPRFHPGSEDSFWAAVNYGKFNRMIHILFGYNVRAKGSDLIRPHIPDLFDYLSDCLHTGLTYLYVNNTYLHKKNHNKFKGSFPTHFIVLDAIRKVPDQPDRIDIVYWDYGGRTLRQVSLRFLKKITFGVTVCTPPSPPGLTSPSGPSQPAAPQTPSPS